MDNRFFEKPIINSPYEYPVRHWELDGQDQPTQRIIENRVDLNLEHLEEMRRSTLLFHVARRLLYTKWRDPGSEPKLHLFGQLKHITRQWFDTCPVCKGGTYPSQLMYQELSDMACERITAGITRALGIRRIYRSLPDSIRV
jgi:type III restriction enzyme